jgi:hypothetical protein
MPQVVDLRPVARWHMVKPKTMKSGISCAEKGGWWPQNIDEGSLWCVWKCVHFCSNCHLKRKQHHKPQDLPNFHSSFQTQIAVEATTLFHQSFQRSLADDPLDVRSLKYDKPNNVIHPQNHQCYGLYKPPLRSHGKFMTGFTTFVI